MVEWGEPPGKLHLPEHTVHIWRVSLAGTATSVEQARAMLSQEERDRAARFRFPRDEERFIIAHGRLRSVLGRYLGAAAQEVRFRNGPKGKPSLADPVSDIRFNLAHSGELALFAVTRGNDVGVDIERVRPGISLEKIADRFFSAREAAELRSLPREERPAAFFRCWTRKEALLKALGEGLTFGLARFTAPEGPQWLLRDLDPAPGYAGAVAVRGPIHELRRWRYPDSKD